MAAKQVPLILACLINCFDWSLPHGMLPNELDMDENFGITLQKEKPLVLIPKAQLRDTVEVVQPAGELLVRLKEAEETADIAQLILDSLNQKMISQQDERVPACDTPLEASCAFVETHSGQSPSQEAACEESQIPL
ncbi:hypothetical protein IFM89_032857 [Coptis chinensis]|uniref:Uncharacterized protein n=1 Tax=Coptis chinensis TaxID=261450 RepID=A0A835IDG4_9MAGN|nr:hypothetical protein IFM89_032857 [Coptis chinensis]